jgi:hypothetical protein
MVLKQHSVKKEFATNNVDNLDIVGSHEITENTVPLVVKTAAAFPLHVRY